ncbi:MAG: Zn-ribbon domain-containing OB-fold protein [Deltaproteobacteria bacterium]|nr:Zn-ribbon domain-containing OB-fold protein [Deltaproteobacteria bacterium]
MSERIVALHTMDLTWRYASGEAMERFCAALCERRIEALQCDGCGRRYLPPRPMCGNCRLRLSRWVPVADEGTLVAWTVVHVPILDGRTGELRPAPYGMGLIRLDGADTTLNHFLAEANPARLALGLRVRAVWRPDLRGAMDDILHFEVLP